MIGVHPEFMVAGTYRDEDHDLAQVLIIGVTLDKALVAFHGGDMAWVPLHRVRLIFQHEHEPGESWMDNEVQS